MARIRQLTTAAHGHTIANRGCWSADSASILYDLRDDETCFDGLAIERVWVASGRVEQLYRSSHGACCGVPTCSPCDDRYVFIHGDEDPDDDWRYCAWHRRGAVGRIGHPGFADALDARDIVAPYTAGALRGGTHLHTFNTDATAVLSTYEDHVLATSTDPLAQANRRTLAVTLLDQPVVVPQLHRRNRSGSGFTVCVTPLSDAPRPGSDELLMATGEAWVGSRPQIAFQGTVLDDDSQPQVELFLVELPVDLRELMRPGAHPLEGTLRTRPGVPAGIRLRRLTHTSDRRFPGLAGPRHWAMGSPDGTYIGCYLRDDKGRVQFCTVSSENGELRVVTNGPYEPTSAFTWHPDGSKVTYVADGSVMLVHLEDGRIERLTPRRPPEDGPTHHACVISPEGTMIAFMQPVRTARGRFNQLHVVDCAKIPRASADHSREDIC